MEKDCTLYFSDDTAPYEFASANLALALKTAAERKWPVLAIKTPEWMLSIFTHEEYEKATGDKLFTDLGV